MAPPVPGATEGIWDAPGGEGGIYALLGFVGSSQAKELLWDEDEEEELRLLVLGLAELALVAPLAPLALVTSGPAGLRWPRLWDVRSLPGHGSRAGIPNLAQDFTLCPSCASALGILGILGELRGFPGPRQFQKSPPPRDEIWVSTGSLSLLPNAPSLHFPLRPFAAPMDNG